MEHTNGPLPSENSYIPCTQFRDAVFKNYAVSTKTGDNCIQVGCHIGVIQNIFKCKSSVYIMYRKFLSSESFFMYPMDSRKLGVYMVSRLSGDVDTVHIQFVKRKYVLLPYRNQYVAFPLLHTMNSFRMQAE